MPLPEPRDCGYRNCRKPLDMSRPASTRYCDANCKHAEFEARRAAKKPRRHGKRPDTSYVVFEQVAKADVQTLRLVGITAANRREEAVEKLREYAPTADLIPIPTRSLASISPD